MPARHPASRHRRRALLLRIGTLCTLGVLLSSSGCSSAPESRPPRASRGVLDLSAWDADGLGYVPARGEWNLYWQRFLRAEALSPTLAATGDPPLHDPGLNFDRTIDGASAEGRGPEGWATYHLRVVLPPRSAKAQADDPWMVAVESQGRPYRLEVLDRAGQRLTPPLIAGAVGVSPETSIASDRDQRRPLLQAPGDTIDLLLHTSYFANGYRAKTTHVTIGRSCAIDRHREGERQDRLIVIGVSIVMGLYHLGLFILRRGERAPLFFSLLCLLFALRQFFRFDLFEDRTPGLDAFPLHATFEYISLFLLIPLFVAFLRALFPLDLPRVVAVAVTVFAVVASLLTILPLGLAELMLSIYEPFILVISLIAAAAMVRAIYYRRDPAVTTILGVGIAILLSATLNDILYNHSLITTVPLEHVGMFAFIFAQAVVLALLNMRARRQTEDLLYGLRRFVPGEFSQILGKHDITDVHLGDAALAEMTVLFCDIRNFTSLSERNDASSTFSLLNTIYAQLAPLIREHGGFIDKYIGDAIMAIFPGPPPDSLRAAVAIAQTTRSIILPEELTSSTTRRKHLAIGIGIHRGPVMLGTIGEHQRMEATVIADAVNVASRLEGLSKRFGAGILLSGELFRQIQDSAEQPDPSLAESRPLGRVRLAGKQRSVLVHEIFAAEPPAQRSSKMRTKAEFAAALAHFERGDFAAAATAFAALARPGPETEPDKAAAIYAAAAAKLQKHPPSRTWDGALVISRK